MGCAVTRNQRAFGAGGFYWGGLWNVNSSPWCAGEQQFGTGDFDGDGKTDLYCHDSSGNVWIALSLGTSAPSGAGGFYWGGLWNVNSSPWCAGEQQFGTGDFDGDGKTDLYCHDSSGNVWIALSLGTSAPSGAGGFYWGGLWNVNSSPWCAGEQQFGTGDFDGDGKTDLYCHDSSDNVWIALSLGTSAPSGAGGFYWGGLWNVNSSPWCAGEQQFGTGDFDGDGKTDLYCHDSSGNVWVTLSLGTSAPSGAGGFYWGGLWNVNGSSWCSGPRQSGAGDFNGDRKSDLYCHDSSGNIWIALSSGLSSPSGAGGFCGGWLWGVNGDVWAPEDNVFPSR